jgi:hypothetical protein
VWLKKLNAIADKGEEFQKSQAKIAAAAAEAIEASYKPQRERALRVVRFADERPKSLGAWFDRLAEKDEELAHLFRCMLPKDFRDPKQISFDTFALWLERTRRYSFYL